MHRGAILAILCLLGSTLPASAGDLTVWTYLVPDLANDGDEVGAALAVDLPWLAVGAPGARQVHIYLLAGGDWQLHQTLNGDPSFGTALDMDGGRLVIGAPEKDRASLWSLQSGQWRSTGTLSGGERFGEAVALDGDRMAIGAPGDAGFNPFGPSGTVQTYTFANGWQKDDLLERGGPGAESRFGAAVDLQGDQLIVGAPARSIEDELLRGAVYVFQDQNGWRERAHIQVDQNWDRDGAFGTMVAIDGRFALAGSPPRLIDGIWYDGHLFFFEKRGNTWTQTQQETTVSASVALDGERAVLGSTYYDETRVVVRDGSHWKTLRVLDDPDIWYASGFGAAVALQDDMVFVGAPQQDTYADRDSGAVWTFVENEAPVAVAGLDTQHTIEDPKGTLRVAVDGSASYDPDGQIVRHTWSWHGETVHAARTAFFLPPGTHELRLLVTDDLGFTDSDTRTITITPAPRLQADFTFTPDHRPPGTPVRFTDRSTDDAGVILSWDWDFDGDGTVDATGHAPTHQYSDSGTYEASLTVKDHLGHEATHTRTVHVRDAAPVADAGDDIIVDRFDEAGNGIATLDGTASRDAEGGVSHQWSIQGVPISSEPKLEWTFPQGVSQVRLMVRDEGGYTDTDTVEVLVPPSGANATRSFNSEPSVNGNWQVHPQELPHTLVFEDASFDAESDIAFIAWDFDGDGDWDSQDEDVAHRFPGKGRYTVAQRAVDMNGAIAERTFEVDVPDRPPGAAFIPEELLRVPLGAPVVFTDLSHDHEELVAWEWDLGGTSSRRQDVGKVFDTPGRHHITLVVTDSAGAKHLATGFLDVYNVTDDVLAAWDQETAVELESEGRFLFDLPAPKPKRQTIAPEEEQADRATFLPGEEGSPFVLSYEEDAPSPPLWWLWLLLALLVLLAVDQERRRRRRVNGRLQRRS